MKKVFLIIYCIVLSKHILLGQTTTINYTSSTADIANPERGIYHHTETHSNAYTPLNVATLQNYRTAENVTLILRIFYLDDFVNAAISANYLAQMQTDFNRIRMSGIKCIVRFAYTNQTNGWPPTSPYGDATKAWMLQHIAQVEPYLQNNSDVIALVQTGFIGIWGEWYYTTHFGDPLNGAPTNANYNDRKDVTDRILAALPNQRMIQLRTPYFKYRLYRANVLTAVSPAEAFSGSAVSRIGHHNDCFLASTTDFGTYVNTATEYPYLINDTRYTPMGGETCQLNAPRTDCSGDAINEMSAFHWSYLNRDYINTVWNGWIAQGCSLQIKKNLGYRLQLNSGTYANTAKPGGSFDLNISLTNIGWASAFNPRLVEIVLENITDGTFCRARLTDDPRLWLAGSTIQLNYQIGIPANYVNGNYKVHLSLPDPMVNLYEVPTYSIRVANGNSTWNTSKGYNYLSFDLNVNSAHVLPNYSGSLWFENCYGGLPLQWLQFDAYEENENIQLNWSTVDEINQDYFEVERSNDGIHFNALKKVEPIARSTNAVHHYSCVDSNPHLGINYYRIVQYDTDGKFSASAIKNVVVSSKVNYTVYSNPFTEQTSISSDGKNTGVVEVLIYDMQGKLAFTRSTDFANPFMIGKELNSGVYIVKIITATQVESFMIIKL